MLALGALGVVFGDIGTSPIYALRQGLPVDLTSDHDHLALFGLASLIVWGLLLIVTLKYVMLVLRADNDGEGGPLALFALLAGKRPQPPRGLTLLAIMATALLLGDAAITPAISVLSAVEGVRTLHPSLSPIILPSALVILALLFAIQRYGTGRVGTAFGPIMLVYFLSIGALGLASLAQSPEALRLISPEHALAFLLAEPATAFLALGAVMLALTGAEALYADLGHFGRVPIRLAWLWLVLPALLLNYLGQAALILRDPGAAVGPFFLLAPPALRAPLLVLATIATVIASQAVITGTFSLIRQAMQLGLFPRLRTFHTSLTVQGQVFLPAANTFLFAAVCAITLGFGSSAALASAYGMTVAGTMLITTLLLALVAARHWGWGRRRTILVIGPLLAIDALLVASNLPKISAGAWLSLSIALAILMIMTSWEQGSRMLRAGIRRASCPDDLFPELSRRLRRVDGMAVHLTSVARSLPPALLRDVTHHRAIHEQIILLTIEITRSPQVFPADRFTVRPISPGLTRITMRFGFAENPDVPKALRSARELATLHESQPSFFVARYAVGSLPGSILSRSKGKLFRWLLKNGTSAAERFHLPPDRVLELGLVI